MEEKKILVVDDSSVNLKLAGKIIKAHAGWHPVLVPSAQRALKYLQEHMADLLLLDVMMPDMDGLELLKILKSDARLAAIPVVMLTGDEDEEIKAASLQNGAEELISKPFDAMGLQEAIARYIG